VTPETRDAALEHARREAPREACGLVIVARGRERYIACRNEAHGTEHFVLNPDDYAAAEDAGDVVAVFHSHPKTNAQPSQPDRVGCEASGLPWFIVNPATGQWAECRPEGYRAPLVGRQFCHGVTDCYSLIRDWYALERGVTLPDFDRRQDWWHGAQELYLENFAAAGFERTEQPQAGDVVLMRVSSQRANHGGILLDGGIILHHLQGRLSSREVYGGYWRKITACFLRYVGTST